MTTYIPRLSKLQKIGYGLGSAADSMSYDFILAFLLFFITVIGGVDIGFAGLIMSVAVVWDAITDPIVGMLCDKTFSRMRTRRPWLIISVAPLVGSLILLFSTFGLTGIFANIYYLVFSCIFWLSYTSFAIPYYAIGASITDNNDERTVLRSFCQVCQYVGVFFAASIPTALVGILIDNGMSRKSAWQLAVICLGILIAIAITCTFLSIKNKELTFNITAEDENTNAPFISKSDVVNFFHDIVDVCKLKAFRWITLSALLYQLGYAMSMSTIMYALFFIGNMTEGASSLVYGFTAFAGIFIAAAMGKIGVRWDKRSVSIICLVVSGFSMCSLNVIDYGSLQGFLFVALLYSIGSVTYWTLIYAMLYDVIEIDEFKNGKRREGLMFAFFTFCQKIAYAIATASISFVLSRAGFVEGALIQSDTAISAINNIFTLFPGVSILLCSVCLFIFPVSRPAYNQLMVQLLLKREGKDYNSIGFERLLD